jgi:hypothetical protein
MKNTTEAKKKIVISREGIRVFSLQIHNEGDEKKSMTAL